MKNLYKLASEQKFRGIFQQGNPETKNGSEETVVTKKSPKSVSDEQVEDAKNDVSSMTDNEKKTTFDAMTQETEDTVNSFLGRAGVNLDMIKDTFTLLFGDWDELMELLKREYEDGDDNSDENSAKNLKSEPDSDKNAREEELEKLVEKGEKLSASQALSSLSPNISIWSTDHEYHRDASKCKKRNGTNTSLEGVLPWTISGVNFLQQQLGVPLVITGGTEDGHGGGLSGEEGTHGFGSKLDISLKNGTDTAMKSYIGRCMALKKGTYNGKKTREKGKFKGNYETWVIKDGGYTMTITKEKNVKGGDHYDIKFA